MEEKTKKEWPEDSLMEAGEIDTTEAPEEDEIFEKPEKKL